MQALFSIFSQIIGPLFFMMGIGYLLQRRLGLDMQTLSRINFYIFVPALMFVKFSQADLLPAQLGKVALFSVVMVLSLMGLGLLVSRLRGYQRPLQRAFATTLMFYNSGNYGLPVIELLYANPFATGVQTVIMSMQNLLNFTLGLFLVANGGQKRRFWDTLGDVVRLPFVYAIGGALLVKYLHIPVWRPAWVALEQIANALVPVALVTLGAQLATVERGAAYGDVLLSNVLRLVGGPLLALLWVNVLQVPPDMARVLLIGSGVPTAVNVVLLAIEYKNEPAFVSRAIFTSTLLSAVTMTLVIYFVTGGAI